jgi:molecular chaperone DnaK (HSP70)
MPQVKARVDAEFHCNAKLTDPNECVAKGAAILALNKSYMDGLDKYDSGESDTKPKLINANTRINATNVTSKNYGVGLYGNVIANLILAQTPLDGHCKASRDDFTLVMDNQQSVRFPIYESDECTTENYPTELGTLLGEDSLELPLPNKRSDHVKIVFDIDTEGFLHIHCEVLERIIDFNIRLKGVMNANELQIAKEKMAKENIN